MFRFKFDTLRNIRGQLEEAKKRELGSAIAYRDKLVSEKIALLKEKETLVNDMIKNTQSSLDVHFLKEINDYMNYIEKCIQRKNHQITEAEKEVEKKRQELIEAMKDKKILDNLRELHKEYYYTEEKRIEQKQVDEIVSYKYSNEKVKEANA